MTLASVLYAAPMRRAFAASRIHMRFGPMRGDDPCGLALSMNAMTYQEEFRAIDAGSRRSPEPFASDVLPKFESFVTSPFLRPDPDIVSASIPVFFIGRNRNGLWVARDAEGKRGGIFWRRQSALDFAHCNARPTRAATVLLQDRFELDIENAGNPFAARLGSLIGKMSQAVKRRLGDFRLL
jgi:hypothetical protein